MCVCESEREIDVFPFLTRWHLSGVAQPCQSQINSGASGNASQVVSTRD